MLLLAAKPTLWISNQVYFFVWTSLITESFVIYPMKVLIYVVFCCNSLTWEVFLLGRHLVFFQYSGKWRQGKRNSSELSQLNSSENNSKLAIGQKGDIKICAVLKYIFCQSHLEVDLSISPHCHSLVLFKKKNGQTVMIEQLLSLCSGYSVFLFFCGFEMIFVQI